MSYDFKTVRFQGAIPILGVSLIPGEYPRSLLIQCKDPSSVKSIQVNQIDIPNTDFFVFDGRSVIAILPEGLTGEITSVLMWDEKYETLSNTAKISLSLFGNAGKVQGIFSLLQLVLKVLSTDVGSDLYLPNVGGGLSKILKTGNASSPSDLSIALRNAVDKTATDLRNMQAKDTSLSSSERLGSIDLVDIRTSPDNRIKVSLRVTNLDGQSQITSFPG